MPRPFGAVPNIINSIASPINVAFLDQNWAQLLTDFNDSSIGYTNWGVDTGIANAYTVTIAGPLTAYATGMVIAFSPANTNTGASTININGVGTVSILDVIGNTPVPGEILAGRTTYLVYNGTVFLLVNSSITGGVPYSYYGDDFNGEGSQLALSASGTGCTAAFYTSQSVGHPGNVAFITSTGGTATYARAIMGAQFLDTFTYTVRGIMLPTVVGSGCIFMLGMDSQSGNASIPRFCVEFQGSTAHANWQCVTSISSSTTVVDSGIAFGVGTWADLEIVVNTSQAVFSINGSVVATITTNIPVSTQIMNPFGALTGGSAGSGALLDTFELLITGIPQVGTNQRFLKGPV
jgi:hypothetical protein